MADTHQEHPDPNDLEALCRHCGQALDKFLHQMEAHNAEVVCPACGKKHETSRSATESSHLPKDKMA